MIRSPARTDFDVLVIGGGMVGACVAAMAAADRDLSSLRIALVEANPPAQPPPSDVELRVSAVSQASQRILDSVGAWSNIPEHHRSAYDEMVVWDAAGKPFGSAAIHFSAGESGEAELGHIIENRRLQWAIYGTEAFRKRVTVLRASLEALQLGVEHAAATLSDGRRITAELVIGADGANSASRTLAAIQTGGWSYEQRAFVTHVSTEHPHRRTAWQRFQAHGPIAFLPLADGRSSIVWTTRPEHAEHLVSAPATAVAAELSHALDGVLGAVEITSERASFPLQLSFARQYCLPRFALVGDAAHAVHPLAGQGVNLGFLDAAALIETLSHEIGRGGDAGTMSELRVLRRYERWRKSENMLALGLIDGLNRLFSNSSDALGWVRRTGLSLVNGSAIAKRSLMGRAMGTSGDVPKLASRSR